MSKPSIPSIKHCPGCGDPFTEIRADLNNALAVPLNDGEDWSEQTGGWMQSPMQLRAIYRCGSLYDFTHAKYKETLVCTSNQVWQGLK